LHLTDAKLRNAQPRERTYRLNDGRGLVVLVTPKGQKWWRFRYRQASGKENQLSLGMYPDLGLHDAREKRETLRKLLAKGIDPSVHRKLARQSARTTFEPMAREWLNRQAKPAGDDALARDSRPSRDHACTPAKRVGAQAHR
jgi:hypothetical protein